MIGPIIFLIVVVFAVGFLCGEIAGWNACYEVEEKCKRRADAGNGEGV